MAAKKTTKRSTSKKSAKKAAPKKAKSTKAKAKAKPAARRAKPAAKPAKAAKAAPPKKSAAPKAAKAPAPPKAAAAAVPTKSRFVWFDLVTKDLGAAQSFYKSLLGWETKDVDVAPPMNKYTMFVHNGEQFGGVIPPPDANAPPTWLPYISVEDVDKVTNRAGALGGKVLMAPADIPNVGRFSVISDPTGGVVSPMSFLQPPKPQQAQGLVGPVAWCELLTSDTAKAGAFYTDLFGWARNEIKMGPEMTYHMFKTGDRDAGGMAGLMPPLNHTAWVTYFAVPDVDERHGAAKAAGAKELVPPSDIPNVGRFSWLTDPQGALFALFKGSM
ncbi:MAG TPA: VOC family protein [Myxococcaceae bacterium]|jgi:hypothetical protein